MTDATPPEETPDGEPWEEVTQRVAFEESSIRYATSLFQSMMVYKAIGFTEVQAWELTLAEHHSRLDVMGQNALMQEGDGTA